MFPLLPFSCNLCTFPARLPKRHQQTGPILWDRAGLFRTIMQFDRAAPQPSASRSRSTTENLFWFFTYHLTVTPVLILLPIFLLLGGLVPLAVYRSVARVSVVERLREAEG